MFTVVLDTCVLWPSQQRNFFLSLAVEGLYRPVWSSVVLDELRHEERDERLQRGEEPVVTSRLASRLIDRMTTGFGDALVHGWERLDGTLGLPDGDDEHVVASAVVGGAGAIVTHNQRDFPTRLMPWGVEVMTPDRFALTTVELDPSRGADAIRSMAGRTGRSGPAQTPHDIMRLLQERYEMHEAVEVVRPHL